LTQIADLVEGLVNSLGIPREEVQQMIGERLALSITISDQSKGFTNWTPNRVPGFFGGIAPAVGGVRSELWVVNPPDSGVDAFVHKLQVIGSDGANGLVMYANDSSLITVLTPAIVSNRDTRFQPLSTSTSPRNPTLQSFRRLAGTATSGISGQGTIQLGGGNNVNPVEVVTDGEGFYLGAGWCLGVRPNNDNQIIIANFQWWEEPRRR